MCLLTQPGVLFAMPGLLLFIVVTRTIDFDDKSPLETKEVDDMSSEHNLACELSSLASPVANSAPDDSLGLRRIRALLPGETTQDGAWDF